MADKKPFQLGTRQHINSFDRTNIAIGNQASVPLPPVGFLSGLLINVRADVTLTAPGVLTTDAPWNILKRLRIVLNSGVVVYDTSGFGAFIVNQRMLMRNYDPLNPGIFQIPNAAGVNHWEFSLYVPVAQNERQQFITGLVNLQAQMVSANVEFVFANNVNDVISNCTGIAGTIDTTYVFYELPDPFQFDYPPYTTHRIMQIDQPIITTGDFEFLIPREGILLQLIHNVKLNGLNQTIAQGNFPGQNNLINSMRLDINRGELIYRVSSRAQALWQLLNNGVYPGVYEWNFLDAGVTGTGEGFQRDTFPSDSISDFRSILEIDSSAVLGANAQVNTIRRVLQNQPY